MSINKRCQCKTSYQDYQVYQSRQLLTQLTSEAKQHLAEQIQARVILGGEQPVNGEVYQLAVNKLKEARNETTK